MKRTSRKRIRRMRYAGPDKTPKGTQKNADSYSENSAKECFGFICKTTRQGGLSVSKFKLYKKIHRLHLNSLGIFN